MPEGSPSVLIIRLDAIGDALALTPAVAALRRRGIPVDLVLRAANAGIFAPAALRETIVADFALRSDAPATLQTIERLGDSLRSRRYTHVVVPSEDPGGYRLAAAVGAPVRIGFSDPWSKPLKALWTRRLLTKAVYRSARLRSRSAHEYATLFALFAPLIGDDSPERDPRELRRLVLTAEPARDPRVALQITDKWERLGIPSIEVVELVRRLAANAELRLLAARVEAAYAEPIAAAAGIPVELFDEMEPWKNAIGAAAAIVAPDSGAVHVAGTIGTPVVAVFPPQPRYAAQIARWAPWAAPYRIVRADTGWPGRAAEALAALRLQMQGAERR